MFHFLGIKKQTGNLLQSGEVLISEHESKVKDIFHESGVQQGTFGLLYRPALENFAEYTQMLPASEYHHHSFTGGLLVHVLDVVICALKVRNSMLLPVGETTEIISKKADLYTYGVFVCALMHDIGKPVVDMEVLMVGKRGRKVRWNPYSGTLIQQQAKRYTFRYRPDRDYELHKLTALSFLADIVPSKGLRLDE